MVKKIIKKVIGQNNITAFKQNLKYVRDKQYLHTHSRIDCLQADSLYQKFQQPGRHIFFGYYDIQQLDINERRMLVHAVGKTASPKCDTAELGYYDVTDNSYHVFSNTSAWCWQQGSRLRWHPVEENKVMFNDVENGAYICKVMDVETKEVTEKICCALYDVDISASYGLSLNFSRLQRLRPGYGYGIIEDDTETESAPEDDGIFFVDLKKNTSELLVSLHDLASQVSDDLVDQHYINHISISPDGNKFMFFHIWTLKGDTHWRTRLCVYSIANGEIKVVEDQDRVSHYDWKNNDELIVTCWDKDKKQYYCIYNLNDNQKVILRDKMLEHDGHPSFLTDGCSFISDTYPLANDMQALFRYDIGANEYFPILRVYSDARMYEEKRCDLHPRVSRSEKCITIDSTCENGCRQVLLIRNWRDENA